MEEKNQWSNENGGERFWPVCLELDNPPIYVFV
jgi:hypothetical protein